MRIEGKGLPCVDDVAEIVRRDEHGLEGSGVPRTSEDAGLRREATDSMTESVG